MSQNIEEKLEKIVSNRNIYRTGTVVRVNSFVVETTGLDDVFYFEKVYIGSEKNIGYIDKIEANNVYVSVVKEEVPIKIGDSVISTKEPLMSYFSPECMGMIVDMFGNDKLTGKPFNNSRPIMIETPKIEIMDRGPVNRPLETGIAAIDMLYPIGRGQRQLIIGDKKIGKTQITLDTICNQRDKDMICIYIAIGKTKKELKAVYTKLIEKGANAYTIIVSAFNDDPVPVLKLTPYVGVSMAEEFLKEGKDVLVIIDDLKKHADACREIALIANKNTGRDAYPADIFYTHSRLLEKGCQHKNGGSITILPIIETKGNDITDYISTNVISITDGQIVLSPKLFEKGQKPAIDYGLSVSRLGSAVQKEQIVDVGATIRKTLLSYLETAEVYELVNEETMTPELKHQLKVGKRILNLLKQPKFTPLSAEELVSRFEFIYTEEGDNEDVLKTIKGESNKEEEVIKVDPGLDEALDKAQTMQEFNPVGDITFEDVVVENNTPAVETPIVDAPVVDIPIVEAPVVDAPAVDAPVVEAPVVETEDEPVFVESPVVDAPVVEEPTKDTVVEEPVFVEAPQTEEITFEDNTPVVEAPIVDAPIVDAPIVDVNDEEEISKEDTEVEETTEETNKQEEVVVDTQDVVFEESIVEPPVVEETQDEVIEEEVVVEEEPTVEEVELPVIEEVQEKTPEDDTVVEETIEIPDEIPAEENEEAFEETPVEEVQEIELPKEQLEEATEEITLAEAMETEEPEEEIELPKVEEPANDIPVVENLEIELPLANDEKVEENPIEEIEPEEEIELPTIKNEEEEEVIELPIEKDETVEENPISEIEEEEEFELPKVVEEDEEEIELPTLNNTEEDDDEIEMPTLATSDKSE